MNITKFLFSITLLIGLAHADVSIDWVSFTEVKDTDGTSAAPANYLAQLIWSNQNVVFSSIIPSDPLTVDSGFEVIHSQPMGFDGFILGDPSPVSFVGNSYVDGYVYSRVFSSATPTQGVDFWGQSSNWSNQLVEFDNQNPVTTTNVHNPVNIVVSNEIIPEPSTILMLVTGLLGLIAFKRRK